MTKRKYLTDEERHAAYRRGGQTRAAQPSAQEARTSAGRVGGRVHATWLRALPPEARRLQDVATRFWAKVHKTDTCWLWEASRDAKGYGFFGLDGKVCRAHRVAYLLTYGDLPADRMVEHRCDTPACVRPDHLVLGTQVSNMADMVAKGRSLRGDRHPRAKLTAAQVRAIRARYTAGGVTAAQLATEFGVRPRTVRSIVTHRTWAHLEEAPHGAS